MKKLLLGSLLALGGVLLFSPPARATVCTVPNTITNGAIIDATPVQQNFNALVSCANNIDWSNIGPAGIYASQIIPISKGTATFGSGQNYTFENALIVLGGIVVDSTALPTDGVAGGASNHGFRLWSNGGSSAEASFHLLSSTAVPSSQPVLDLSQPGNNPIYFEVSSGGDGTFNGGLTFDGAQPDGSSLIGGGVNPGGSPVPFWLISQANNHAGANFAFKDNTDSIPAILVENSGANVIFTVDGAGNVQAKNALGIDNQTPPPSGIADGFNSTSFTFDSNTTGTNAAFAFLNPGGSNANFANFNNGALLIAQNGQVTIGTGGNTVIGPNQAIFPGTVAVATVGPSSGVCTNAGSQLISCAGSSVSMYTGGSNTPVSNGSIIFGTSVLPITCPSPTVYPGNGGSVTATFPPAVNLNNYAVTITGQSRNVIYTVSNKTTGSFQINGDVFGCYSANVSVDWEAVGK